MTVVGYILTGVGTMAAAWGAGDTLAMTLARKPVMRRLVLNNWLMSLGLVVMFLGAAVVLSARPTDLAIL